MSPLAQVLAEANRPSPAPNVATIAPTNVAGIYNNYNQAKMDEYKAQLANQNAMFGGLASLGSAGISVLPKLFGAGTAAAGTGAAASGGSGALASLLPFMIA